MDKQVRFAEIKSGQHFFAEDKGEMIEMVRMGHLAFTPVEREHGEAWEFEDDDLVFVK